MDTLVPGRALDFEHPEFNDVRREWYLCGALHGLVRKRDAETIKTILTNRSDDFGRASARPGGPGAAMARTLVNGFIEMGRITEAALLVRGQAGEMVGYVAANGALSKASDLLRDNDLTSAGTLLNALDQAQHLLQGNDPRTQAFRRHLARRLGQYHQAQGNFKQATALFERLQKEDGPEQASDIITDLGLVLSGRKSLVEVKLPVDREQRTMLLEALRRGASLFEQAVRSEGPGATNAHYALAMLKYLERSQEKNRASASQLSEQALRHAQEALNGMRLAEAALAYDRLGLTGQCLFIQAVLQMERLDAVDARAAIAAWTQITADAGTFPLEDVRGLIEVAEVVDAEIAVQIAESVWKYRPNGAVELVQFDNVLSRSKFLQERLLEIARQPIQPRPQQWELWTRLIPILLLAGNNDAAEEGLDALQQLAENEAYARQFVEYLSKTRNYDPAWDEADVKWARIRVARRMGDDQLCGAILRELFFEVRDSNPAQALQIVDLCTDWKIDSSHHKDLAARMPANREGSTNLRGLEERLKGGEAVRVLFVGGNEIQERFDQDISEILRREWPGIEIIFRHTGWSSNWGRELDGLKREANASDCVVLMTMMRTMLGRKLRTGLSKPWLTCAATGRSGIQNSIRDAARIGLQTRTGARRT
jgi:tetratricopeptide (TPR) repeat protein